MPPPGGARVAGYEVIAEIGRGGMGVVYLAANQDGDHVAVKTVLPDHRGDSERLLMIADEAALTARLDHPNIIAVRELADHEGAPALVLDYVHGESLASILIECVRLPEPLVARIGADVAAALAAAAAAGVVHRDVAPQNVLIGYDGSVRLGDFGVAWAAEGREAVTAAGVVKGRVAYMAPEQLAAGKVAGGADVYALGVMLARALSGKLPERDAETGEAIELPAAIEGEWRELIAGATADDPDERTDAATLAAALAERAAGAAELGGFIGERFAASRELKESIIERGSDLASSETELLDTGAGETEKVAPPSRTPRYVVAAAVVAAIAVVALAALRRPLAIEVGAPPPAAAPGPLCIVSGPIASAAERDPTYVVVRLVSRLLVAEGAVAGFRGGDRCPDGARVIALVGAAAGAGRVIEGARETPAPGETPAAQARAMAAIIAPDARPAIELGDREWRDWRRALRLLRIRELIYLARGGDKSVLDAAVREDAELEQVHVIDAWSKWVSGALRPDTISRPATGSEALGHVLDALLAMAAGDTDAARARAAEADAARESASPALRPLIDMVAGEAAFHGGDPVAGAAAFERALAAEPDLLIAIYHLARFRMARGDFAGVDELADHWARLDPAASSPADLRARALVGRGDYDAALEAFDAIVRESISGPASSAEVGRILTLAMAGRTAEAAAAAKAMAELSGGDPHVVAVIPEPAGYALARWSGDAGEAAYWSSRVAAQLDDEWEENHIALAATMDLIDAIAGVEGARPRLAGEPPPARRRYRFRDRVAVLGLLRGRAVKEESTLTRAFAAALRQEAGGDTAAAIARLGEALDHTAEGELDCVILWKWAELARRHRLEDLDRVCERLARPRVPTPLCVVARCR